MRIKIIENKPDLFWIHEHDCNWQLHDVIIASEYDDKIASRN